MFFVVVKLLIVCYFRPHKMEICIEYRPRLQIANIAVFFTANQEEDFARSLKNVRCEPDTVLCRSPKRV
jgi:hypothetical protein